MKYLIYSTPVLAVGYAGFLYGYTLFDPAEIAARSIAFAFICLLMLQAVTTFFTGQYARAMYFNAGFAPLGAGVITLFGMLWGYATNTQTVDLYQRISPTSAQFQVTNALWGIIGVAMLAWPFLTIAWIARLPHCDQAEAEMQVSQKLWNIKQESRRVTREQLDAQRLKETHSRG